MRRDARHTEGRKKKKKTDTPRKRTRTIELNAETMTAIRIVILDASLAK